MKAKSALIASIATVGIASAANAQNWAEVGDAGPLTGTGQSTVGVGALTSITGSLSTFNDIDLFLVEITNEAAFLATVTAYNSGGDSQLYLFTQAGAGVSFDDDAGAGLLSAINSTQVSANGFYWLAMTNWDSDALNLAGGTQAANGIWHDGTPYTGPFAPDGPGAGSPVLAGWLSNQGTGANTNGAYTITLAGVNYAPAPGAIALLGLAGLVGKRRRR